MKKIACLNISLQNLIAVLLFIGSLSVYLLTLSPTVNFWDCGEFIACAHKLEVGHAPGAPFYLILARFFALFVPAHKVAWSVNLLSALASAFTVLLLYKSTVLLLLKRSGRLSNMHLLAAGLGALTFAFTDSFWFSAVEAEVYALSIFFTAFTIWAVLQWEYTYPKKEANRYLLLIALMMGLSVGVHLLNLLCIPVIVSVVYNTLYPHKKLKQLWGLLIGFGLLVLIQWFVIQHGLWIAKYLELLLVNKINMPVHSGLIAFFLLLFSGLGLGIYLSCKKNALVHACCLAGFFFFMGLSTYALVIIRSQAYPSINLNQPTTVFSLESFLNREQYGQRPLIYGAWFGAKRKDIESTYSYRLNSQNKYEKYAANGKVTYHAKDKSVLQRMYSGQDRHVNGYYYWSDLEKGEKPTFFHQLSFLFRYQLGHMYFRYFMWNFAGRQNDIQGQGDFLNGNFKTGYFFIDQNSLGSRKVRHTNELTSRARNKYFLIPLLIGLLGILYLIWAKEWDLLIRISALFILAGPLIAFYLNQPPAEPRERDYVFVGSFYAFCMFVAWGVWSILKGLQHHSKSTLTNYLVALLLLLALPVLMLGNNFNDHNRKDRTLARDMAMAYLNSCAPNAILFTYGDNDTYPLWYLQEVEEIRKDVRVINVGLLSADWYVQQQGMAQQGTLPLKFTIPMDRYKSGDMDYAAVVNHSAEALDIYKGLQIVGDTSSQNQLTTRNNQRLDFLPAAKLRLTDKVAIQLHKNYVMKGEISLLDIIASNYKERSIYFTNGTPSHATLGFNQYAQDYGIVSRLNIEQRKADVLELYRLFTEKINMNVPEKSWWDETCMHSLLISDLHGATINLVQQLLDEGYTDKAVDVVNRFYPVSMQVNYSSHRKDIHWINVLYACGLKDKAQRYLEKTSYASLQNFQYYMESKKYLGQNMLAYAKEEMKYIEKLEKVAAENNEMAVVALIQSIIR